MPTVPQPAQALYPNGPDTTPGNERKIPFETMPGWPEDIERDESYPWATWLKMHVLGEGGVLNRGDMDALNKFQDQKLKAGQDKAEGSDLWKALGGQELKEAERVGLHKWLDQQIMATAPMTGSEVPLPRPRPKGGAS